MTGSNAATTLSEERTKNCHWVAGAVNLVRMGLSQNRKYGITQNKCRQIF